MSAARPYLPFLDWLKAVGMLLIVYGHVAGWAPLAALPPIFSKQLGVALFLFATGYSLSCDARDRRRVVYNRLFDVFLYGIPFAVVVSMASFATGGRGQLSNYEPFLGGVNVLVDNFPANPSTWYLGTYIHVVLLWALIVSRVRVTAGVIVAAALAELVVRAVLMQTAGLFIAYMAFTNWMIVFLVGYWYGARSAISVSPPASHGWVAAAALVAGVAGWAAAVTNVPFARTFPFLVVPGGWRGVWATSAMVSVLYAGVAWLTFAATRTLAAPGWVRFIARNTLFIFLAHMPLYYLMTPVVSRWTDSRSLRSLIYALACVLGLGLVSELLRRVVRPQRLRERLAGRLALPVVLRDRGAGDVAG